MFQGRWKNHSKLTRGTYSTWLDMRQRCHNPDHAGFAYYGARGISVCDRWRDDYDAFVEDMGLRPEGTTIERINNNGNYEISNCRWATRPEQARNTRRTRKLTFKGETRTIADWADSLGIERNTLYARIDRGIPLEDALKPETLVESPKHGTISMYVSRKCRCDPCRQANREYVQEYRRKRQ